MRFFNGLVFGLLCGVAMTAGASAASLVIGSSTEPTAIDPHFARNGNNQQIAVHIFDRLADQDENLQIRPGLAVSWKSLDPLTWEIKLRPGVKFSDGSPLTPDDIIFSINRVKDIPNSPAPFTGMTGGVASMQAVDATTMIFKTKTPLPQFMELVGLVYIVNKKAAEGKAIADFNRGTAAIGTGPYKFKEWVPGDHVSFVVNENYWGKKPDFDNVTFKAIANDAARVAALRSGAVDLIDAVPPNDVPSLSKIAGLKMFSVSSSRMIYLAIDSDRDNSPFITDTAGKPLAKSPLKDPRVRKAMSKMIDRPLLIDRILQGQVEASGQQVPKGMGGYIDDLQPEKIDLAGAKKLLTDAGYPNGFGLTLHASSDRFPGDAEVAQAIGQMFARGGLKVNSVATLPYSVFATNATKLDYSVFLFSIGNSTSSSGPSLQNLLMTFNKDAGTGSFNRGRYSSKAFDDKLAQSLAEFDPAKSDALVKEATKIAFVDEQAIIPLYWQKVYWAGKSNIDFTPSRREDTTANNARIVK